MNVSILVPDWSKNWHQCGMSSSDEFIHCPLFAPPHSEGSYNSANSRPLCGVVDLSILAEHTYPLAPLCCRGIFWAGLRFALLWMHTTQIVGKGHLRVSRFSLPALISKRSFNTVFRALALMGPCNVALEHREIAFTLSALPQGKTMHPCPRSTPTTSTVVLLGQMWTTHCPS
jgi:hypothetical protein